MLFVLSSNAIFISASHLFTQSHLTVLAGKWVSRIIIIFFLLLSDLFALEASISDAIAVDKMIICEYIKLAISGRIKTPDWPRECGPTAASSVAPVCPRPIDSLFNFFFCVRKEKKKRCTQ